MNADTAVTPRGLTAEQVNLLLQMIHEGRVRQLNGFDHIEAWDVRRWLTRIFGFAGWSEECLTEKVVYERIAPSTDGQGKPIEGKFRATVVYQVVLRLHIRDVYGNELGFFDQGSAGESVNQPSIGDAYDNALKNAFSGALKRCAIDLGDQFGLSLYDKGRKRAAQPQPAVLRTLGHPQAIAAPVSVESIVDAPVTSGELDAPEVGEAAQTPQADPRTEAVAAPQRRQRGGGHLVQPPKDEPDPWASEPPAEPKSTSKQQQDIRELFESELGVTDRKERLERIGTTLGRDLESTTKLTYAEADDVVNGLRTYRKGRLEREQVVTAFRAGIECATSMDELNSVGQGMTEALMHKKISAADRNQLVIEWGEQAAVLQGYPDPVGASA